MPDRHSSNEAVRLLLVEDSSVDASLVKAQLKHSELRYVLRHEQTLGSSLARLQNESFDVVLLDLTLPDSSGIQTFRRIHREMPDIPVVILSGHSSVETAVTSVREGAEDYLLKGKADGESLTRSIRYAIERVRRQQAEKELNAAGAIQRQLLSRHTLRVPNLDLCGRCVPSTTAGGDYFDFFPVRGNCLGIVVADVSGHGVGPALTMSETRAVLRTLAPLSQNVGDMLTRASRVLADDLVGNSFVALFMACLDPSRNSLQFASAGHPGFLLDSAGRIKQVLKTDAPPLGVDEKTTYQSSPTIFLEPSESLFLYTDGLIECINEKGERYGKKRLFDNIVALYRQSADVLIAKLFESVQAFSRLGGERDDMTSVFVKSESRPAKRTAPPPKQIVDAVKPYKHFRLERKDAAVVLHLQDTNILSSQICQELQTELLSVVSKEQPRHMLLSFRAVNRLSSETINALLRAREAVVAQQGTLKLCEVKPDIRQAFTSLNLDGTIFEFHASLEDAVNIT